MYRARPVRPPKEWTCELMTSLCNPTSKLGYKLDTIADVAITLCTFLQTTTILSHFSVRMPKSFSMGRLSGARNGKPYSKSARGNCTGRSVIKAYQTSSKRRKLIHYANICAKLVTIRPDGGKDGLLSLPLIFVIITDLLIDSYSFDSY